MDTACADCSETRAEALIAGGKPRSCAACQRKRAGKKSTDTHHVAGQNNSNVTVEVPVNDHRAILSVAQYDWPRATRENPDGSPLLAAAGMVRGCAETIQYLLEKLVELVAGLLETLDALLTGERGAKWWVDTAIEGYAP